jgi:hypothetical protein
VDVLFRRLLRAALRRGMGDRNWAWFVIAGCVIVLRRTLSDKGGLVSSVKIAPGDQVLISVRDRSTPAGTITTASAAVED